MGRIMRRLLAVASVLGWMAVLPTLPAQAQSCPAAPPSGAGCAPPMRVIVHVPKPEIVFEESDAKDTAGESGDRCRLFKHKPKRPAAAALPPAVGMIVAPTAALVPAPAGVVAAPVTAAPCHTPGASTSDHAAMRAAHELELNLARLAVARAAHKAEMDAYEATVQRVTSAAMQLGSGAAPSTSGPQGGPPTPERLAQNLQTLTERVDTLDRLVREQHRILREKFPDAFKSAPK
jgi:hypothetical protein